MYMSTLFGFRLPRFIIILYFPHIINRNVLSLYDIYIDMKLIITENKLYNLFVKYMDSQYDLSYDNTTGALIDKDDNVFGYVIRGKFIHDDSLSLEGFFGNKTNKMLKTYLNDKFPGTPIHSIK